MPLYLVHMIEKWSMAFILNVLGFYDSLFTSLVFWPFEYSIIVLISLSIALKLTKKRMYSLLFGGR